MSPLRIVVLGGSGFVGRHLLARLLRDGHSVRLLSRNLAAHAERLLPPGVELQQIDARDVGEFERVLADFAGAPNGGLIVPLSTSAETHRTRIIALADRHQLPAVYHSRVDAALGGLISYGPDTVDLYRRAAGYVDRILRGEKPADLPVQAPTKYQLVINLKTAKALGLEVPPTLLARADEVIE